MLSIACIGSRYERFNSSARFPAGMNQKQPAAISIEPINPMTLSTTTLRAAWTFLSVCLATYHARKRSPPTELGRAVIIKQTEEHQPNCCPVTDSYALHPQQQIPPCYKNQLADKINAPKPPQNPPVQFQEEPGRFFRMSSPLNAKYKRNCRNEKTYQDRQVFMFLFTFGHSRHPA